MRSSVHIHTPTKEKIFQNSCYWELNLVSISEIQSKTTIAVYFYKT